MILYWNLFESLQYLIACLLQYLSSQSQIDLIKRHMNA